MLHIRKYKQIKGKKVIKYLAWNIGITKYEYRKIIIKENITGNIKGTFLVRILKLSVNPWNKDKIISETTGTINPPVLTICLKERAKCNFYFLTEDKIPVVKKIIFFILNVNPLILKKKLSEKNNCEIKYVFKEDKIFFFN